MNLPDQGLQLGWTGKTAAQRVARETPFHALEPVSTHGEPGSGNLLIQGDNLAALKSLLPFYKGRVKCIFIDPPYNTGSAFEHYDDKLQHSQWLSMMLPRLELLKELLRPDGSIWVTIDDNEGHYLKVLMDEVFGRDNFVATFVWQKVDSPNDNKVSITPDHEFVLAYAKTLTATSFNRKNDPTLIDAYGQVNEAGVRYRDRLLKKNGKNSLRADRPTMFYPLTAPDGSTVFPIHDDGREARWAMGEKGVELAATQGTLIWKQRDRNSAAVWIPYTREFAPENPERPHPTILLDVKTSRQAKAHQKALLPDSQQFDTVKPEQLIQRLLNIATFPGDLVLDSFLGSGTTAAVAHKMGRRWIGIEMGNHAQTHCLPRLQKVLDGEPGGISEAVNWQGGGGFQFLRLGPAIFTAQRRISPDVGFSALAGLVWHAETGQPAPHALTTALLGVHQGTACFLLYNGVLGDKRPEAGNVLTDAVYSHLMNTHPHTGPMVVYGEATQMGPVRRASLGITFKQLPYDLKQLQSPSGASL